jgi:hypothetical protein
MAGATAADFWGSAAMTQQSCFSRAHQGRAHGTLQLSRKGLFTGQLCDRGQGKTKPKRDYARFGTQSTDQPCGAMGPSTDLHDAGGCHRAQLSQRWLPFGRF